MEKIQNNFINLAKEKIGQQYDLSNIKLQRLVSNEISNSHKNEMFQMYVISYSGANQELWFKNAEQMFNYQCSLLAVINGDKIICFVMYQTRPYANKLSLGCHDGSALGKNLAIIMRATLLSMPGWVVEASGATSWILRSKYNTPIIKDITLIKKILGIENKIDETVEINDEFDILDKNSYYYAHKYFANGILVFSNKETLFGLEGCIFDNYNCDRSCKSELLK